MPLFGSLDTTALLAGAPEMKDLTTDALVLPSVEILHLLHEIDSGPMLELLPPSLHPTLPPTISVIVWRARGTELGTFTMAQVRIGCRAGVRPRGFLLASVVDDVDAGNLLASRWGYRTDDGTPKLQVSHDRIRATVERDGRTILDVSLIGPEPISGGDIQYVANMNLAHTPDGPRLVQVDPEFEFTKANRGKLQLDVFDAAAWGDARIVPSWPVSTSVATANVTLPKLRYVCKLDVPALQGTETIPH
jgi:hypothetical protein